MSDTSYAAPLAVLDAADGALVAHLPSIQRVDLPADVADLASAAEWALSYGLGAAKLSRHGEDSGPLLVLTESAAVALGLPPRLEDRVRLRVPDDHPAIKALTESGWSLSRAGLSPWSMLIRERQEVHIATIPWGAFDVRITRWGALSDITDPSTLAFALGVYTERVITPTSSSAGTSIALMTALRPPTRRAFQGGKMVRVPVEGSLVAPVDPAPPETPNEHPLAAERTREESQSPAHVLVEEALVWHRTELTPDEAALPYVVGLDVNTAFLAASNRLNVGLGPAVYTDGPAFDKKIPGAWLCDFSGAALRTKDPRTKEWVQLDPRLPSPFTPNGRPPSGAAWYATPTLAYASELGVEVKPIAAWLRPESSGYLDLWHDRLRDAYMATLADLGVTADMPEDAFVAAMPTLKERDPEVYAVLTAIKATAKGGVGKLQEKPKGKRASRHAPWPALKRATWRPDIRAAVISNSRTGQHRKIVKTWMTTGAVPLAVLADCVVYPSAYPTARAVVPRKEDGTPAPGGFRLGPNPGYVKEEGVQTMEWFAEMIAKKSNPARFIKGTDAIRDGE
ncbi:telomere-associated protein Tap [Streptomyces klenkii]